jgi:hypothetical protein
VAVMPSNMKLYREVYLLYTCILVPGNKGDATRGVDVPFTFIPNIFATSKDTKRARGESMKPKLLRAR